MSKINYGIDGAEEIYKIFFITVSILSIAFFANYILLPEHYFLKIAISSLAILSVIGFITITLLMVCSAKNSKLQLWQQIFDRLNLQGHEQILDVGCGHGLQLITAAKQMTSGKVIGIDVWRKEDQFNNHINRTKHNAQLEGVLNKIEIITCDMRKMLFSDNTFDIIFASQSIANIKHNKDREQAIKEISRVLKPSGKLIIVDFFYTHSYLITLQKLGWSSLKRSKWNFKMFPPVRTITGIKPN